MAQRSDPTLHPSALSSVHVPRSCSEWIRLQDARINLLRERAFYHSPASLEALVRFSVKAVRERIELARGCSNVEDRALHGRDGQRKGQTRQTGRDRRIARCRLGINIPRCVACDRLSLRLLPSVYRIARTRRLGRQCKSREVAS